jgi:predicted RNase H-like HicB family nuclease
MVLNLESDGGKWLVVTCPFDPELVTQARSVDEAFAMAYDAKKLLDECRAEANRARAGTNAAPRLHATKPPAPRSRPRRAGHAGVHA